MKMGPIQVTLKSQKLAYDEFGYNRWMDQWEKVTLVPEKTALIITDAWDTHWSRSVVERSQIINQRINEVAHSLREQGVLIVHTPSNVADYYKHTPARQRLLAAKEVEPPAEKPYDFPPLPIDDSDGGSDTNRNNGSVNEIVWKRQHESIDIDQDRDVIADDEGEKMYHLFAERGITTLLYSGYATNMCILNRSFGMKQMLRWGLHPILIKDLTDANYNPARSPYVSHEEGTRLVIEYIEKFVAPTLSSDQFNQPV